MKKIDKYLEASAEEDTILIQARLPKWLVDEVEAKMRRERRKRKVTRKSLVEAAWRMYLGEK